MNYIETGFIRVGVGEWRMGKNSDMLKTTLGSCVGIILYSIKHRTGGIAHILLGEPPQGKITHKGKYARTAIYTLLAEFESMGILSKSVKACLFGGATMFISKNGNTLQNIGIDNVRISKEVLAACNIPIFFEDTGGTKGRSVSLYVDEGKISYTTSGIENYIYIS